jgi:hypothetical protein
MDTGAESVPSLPLAPRIPNRGKPLTVLLVLKGAFGLTMLFIALFALGEMTPDRLSKLPPEALAAVIALRGKLIMTFVTTIVDLVAVTGTWMFKRWGVVVLAASSGALFVLRLLSFQPLEVITAIAGIIVAGSVIATIVPKWHEYE